MLKFIAERIIFSIISLLVLIIVVFTLIRLMPGNPFDYENINKSVRDEMLEHYGLDQPIMTQLGIYLENLVKGDFGVSYKKTGTTVNELISKEAPYTIKMGLIAYAIALVLGIFLGIKMATTKHGSVRGSLMALTVMGISIPNYVLALILMLVFGVILKVLPVVGLKGWQYYILPVTALTVYPLAQISKLVKSSYTEASNQDYVIMAKAKGISDLRISFVHILRNAIIPVITASGPIIAFLLTGSFVVEEIFTINGIGREFVNAVSNRDYTVIMGLTIFFGIILMACNLLADILCAVADPRIKLANK